MEYAPPSVTAISKHFKYSSLSARSEITASTRLRLYSWLLQAKCLIVPVTS